MKNQKLGYTLRAKVKPAGKSNREEEVFGNRSWDFRDKSRLVI